jgi:hypothetical protein
MANQVIFVAPPGWPTVPAGSIPSAGWTPAAELPAPPAGWVFYRGEHGEPVAPPQGSWVPPVVQPPVTEIPLIPAPTPMGSAPFGAPTPAATTPSKPVNKRLLLVVGSLALAAMLTVGVGASFVYNALFAAPQLSSSQFDRLETAKTYGDQRVTFTQTAPIGWLWLGADEGNLAECQESAAFDNEHLISVYQADTNPNGAPSGDVMMRLFGSKADLDKYRSLWAACDAAAIAAHIEDAGGQVGGTDGVAWERYEESGVFWYGDVQVLAVKGFDNDAQMAAEAKAIKATIDSLR